MIYCKNKKNSVFDIFHAFDHWLVASVFFFMNYSNLSLKMLLVYTMILVWCIRLGNLMFERYKTGRVEERYEFLFKRSGIKNQDMFYLYVCFVQAILYMILTSIFFWAFRKPYSKSGSFVQT